MQIPQIRMQSQMAQIQINQTNAELEIRQPQAEMSIRQDPPEVSIRTTPSKLSIDQSKAFEDMNLMPIMKRNTQHAEQGKQAALEGMARRAAEGRRLMEIEQGGTPVAELAKQQSGREMKQLSIKFIPSHFAVKTHYEPSQVDVEVKRNEPVTEVAIHQPVMNYKPGSVETTLKQHAQLEIEFVNVTV
jgi:hypothetical protein